MPRIDDYLESLRLASEALKSVNLHGVSRRAGTEAAVADDGQVLIRLPFIDAPFVVTVGEGVDVRKEGDEAEVPLQERILICHYLLHATGEPPSGELITFRQIPDGHFYFDAFQRRARDPFLIVFGRSPDLFRACAPKLGGRPCEIGDVGMTFQVFPRIAVQLVLWRGDDEFPPEAGILFDSSIQHYLPVEDIAVMTGMLVYRLMGIARGMRDQGRRDRPANTGE